MASDDAVAKPLLRDFEPSSSPRIAPNKSASSISLRTLEDGEHDLVREPAQLRPTRTFFRRLLMAVRRRHNGTSPSQDEGGRIRLPVEDQRTFWEKIRWRRLLIRSILGLLLAVVLFFGIVHIVNVFLAFFHLVQDDADPYPTNWGPLKNYRPGDTPDIDGLTRDVTPIQCHSHNDYWRRIPLYNALSWGCTGVEADVWLIDDDLYVGHKTNSLVKDRTFQSMYVDPLMRILDHQNAVNPDFLSSPSSTKNGVYEVDPSQTVVLLVDFKSDGHVTFPVVSQQLEPFRAAGYLTYFDGEKTIPGPITVVATGNAPFDLVVANSTYRDIFFDAPLDRMYNDPSNAPHNPDLRKRDGQGNVGTDPSSTFDATNSFYASADFKKAIGWVWFGRLSDHQMRLIRGQIAGAQKRGLKARYWGSPDWPVGLRNRVWKVLVEEGVDFLNGDDLRALTTTDWGAKRHWGWLG